jgi:hypothetical protein
MQLDAECPHCSHAHTIDSSFVGLTRKCPNCSDTFLFEYEETDADGNTRALSSGDFGRRMIGCSACFRKSAFNEAYAGMAIVPCGYCGAKFPHEQAERFVPILDRAEAAARTELLAGHPYTDILDDLPRPGLDAAAAERLLDAVHERAPFARAEAIDEADPVYAAPHCDLCGDELDQVQRHVAYRVNWLKVEIGFERRKHVLEQAAELLGDAAVADSGIGGTRGTATAEQQAVYCICKPCRKSLTARFFGRFKGVPACYGFKVARIDELPIIVNPDYA